MVERGGPRASSTSFLGGSILGDSRAASRPQLMFLPCVRVSGYHCTDLCKRRSFKMQD